MTGPASVESDVSTVMRLLQLVVFDFDGVFTDNGVYVTEDGRESVRCDRSDGLGIAYLPDFAIGRQLREGVLVTVLDDYTDRSGPLRVLWPSSRHLAPKLRAFVDFLAANLVPAVEGEADSRS